MTTPPQDASLGNNPWRAPGFGPTMLAVAAAFGAWSILLPVLPMFVVANGGTATLAGATTGFFMAATVITQLFTPWMLRTFGYRPVMIGAAFMLGVPALGHMLGSDAWIALLFSALRGTGFGALTVAESALVAEILPRRLLGKGTGILGVMVGLSQMIFLPVGLWLAEEVGFNTVFLIAAALGLAAALLCLGVPAIKASAPEPVPDEDTRAAATPLWKLVLVPALALTSLSMGFGLLSSLLPVAVLEVDPEIGAAIGGVLLSIVGGAGMLSRYLAGVIADRTGHPGRFMGLFQVVSLVGMLLIAAIFFYEWSLWWLLLATTIYGFGFGAVQNESLLTMFQRVPRSKISQVSAVWNIFYDAGTGLGSVVYGAIVTAAAFHVSFAAAGAVIFIGIVMTALDRQVGRSRGRH